MTAQAAPASRTLRSHPVQLGWVPALAVMAGIVTVAASPWSAAGADGAPTADARRLTFTGQLEVRWIDAAGGLQVAELAVEAEDGALDVDGALVLVADAGGRLVRDQQGWARLWPAGDAMSLDDVPKSSEKYDASHKRGPAIAGRATSEVVLSTGGAVHERVDLDAATGLLLARTVLNPNGSIVRDVRFRSITIAARSTRPARPTAARNWAPRRLRAGRLAAPYEAPRRLARGFRRVGLYRSTDGLQVLYSDGVDSLSVFEEPGSLTLRRLPAQSVVATVGHSRALVWTLPGGQVATWQDGSAVYTVVGDGPLSDVLAAASSMPPAPKVSWAQRVRHACRRVISDLVGR